MSVDSTVITIVFALLVVYYIYICILAVLVRPPPESCAGEEDHRFIFMVPCRNEEQVIAVTIKSILSMDYPSREVLVINDGSTDRTEEVVRGFLDTGAVSVVNTEEPGRGKGEALNYGYRHILERLRREGTGHYENIIIGILDADGQPEPNMCRAVEPYFTDPQVGAVQAAVRIANAETNVITACQDVEFTGFSQAIQKGRDRLCSVGLGGNGQFTRLSALASLSLVQPWNKSLTEDLDIGVRLIMSGWKVRFAPRTFVAQQGVEKVRPLVIQRVRWMQGHYSTWKYIPRIIVDRNLRLRTRFDNTLYLVLGITPFIVFLSILLSLLSAVRAITVSNWFNDLMLRTNLILYLFLIYFLSFVMAIVFVSFYMRYKKISIWRMIFLYNVFAIYTLMWIPASMGAVINMALGRRSWVKTGRTAVAEVSDLRAFPRVEVNIPARVVGEGGEAQVEVRDLSASGVGIALSKKRYLDGPIGYIATGNRVEVQSPVSGKPVSSEVVWVAYLGKNLVKAGLQFVDPCTVDVHEDFGYEAPYPHG